MSTITVPVPHSIIRAVVPVDHRWRGDVTPMTIVSTSGVELQTQWQPVARSADGKVRLAEFIARDDKAEGGVYTLADTRQRDGHATLTPWARAMMGQAPQFDIGNGVISCQWGRYMRQGDVAMTRKFHGAHVVGWMTAYAGEDYVTVEFKLHNASPNSPHWFLRELRLLGDPSDGVLPFFPEPNQVGRQIITARADGKWHFVKQRQQRQFRFVVHKSGADVAAMIASKLGGVGVSDRWTETGAWGPAQVRMPHLPATMLKNMAGSLRAEWARTRDSFTTGASIDLGMSVGPTGRIGIGHVTGSHYGGVTGGGGRWLFDPYGTQTAMTGEVEGIKALMGKCAQIDYRMPALMTAAGGVAQLEHWIDTSGRPKGGWEMSGADSRFERQGNQNNYRDGDFGFRLARAEPIPAGVTYDDAEFAAFDGISPVDFQHYVRAFTAAASLVYMLNDPLAGHSLRGMAEAHRMSMFTQNRFDAEMAAIDAAPHHGTAWGRSQGHGYDCQSIAYYVSDKAWRDKRSGHLALFASMMDSALMPNGCLQSMAGNKEQTGPVFQSQHRIEKATEAVFLAFAAYGAEVATYGEGASDDPGSTIEQFASQGIAVYHGGEHGAPTDYTAVAPPSRSAAPYDVSPLHHNHDRTEVAIAYGIALGWHKRNGSVPPPALTAAIKRYCGNAPDPRAWMVSQSLYKLEIDDTLALLAALE